MLFKNVFALGGFFLGVICAILTFILLIYGKTRLHRIWALFNIAVAIWGFGSFAIGNAATVPEALIAWKIAHVGVIFIAVLFFHTVSIFCNVEGKLKNIIIFAYSQGLFFLLLISGGAFISGVRFIHNSIYYNESTGILYPVFFFIWAGLVVMGHYELILYFKKAHGQQRNQTLYLFLGMLIGFSGGTTNFLPMFKIDIYPFGNFSIPLYCIIVTYAILHYHLMDINVAITRVGIFITVYAIFLGLPFFLGYKHGLWQVATWIMLVFASTGPFIYRYLQKKAEKIMLREQHRYQRALRELSREMARIRDLDGLLKSIVTTVADTVAVDSVAFYLKDELHKSYKCKYCYHEKTECLFAESIPLDGYIIGLLCRYKRPLLREELQHLHKMSFNFSLIAPCFMEEELLGFMMLGGKPQNSMYTPDDMLVFETFSYSAALAIENCNFWREIEERQRAARLREMDTYSYSLAHEIDNPVYTIIGQAEVLERVLLKELDLPSEKERDVEGAIRFILDSAWRVSAMVKAIRDFGQPVTGEFKLLKISDVIESFAQLYFSRFKSAGVAFIKDAPEGPEFVRGEKPELMQVLVILANNSLHAMQQAKEKRIVIKVENVNHEWVRISFSDTGYGIKKEDLGIIFQSFVTTKASSEGTGMGLYNAKKIIKRHKGMIWAESKGKDSGAVFFIDLPRAADVKPEALDNIDKGINIFKNEDTLR